MVIVAGRSTGSLECMRRNRTDIAGIDIADHFVTGILSALIMAITIVAGVVLAAVQAGPDLLAVFRAVHIWGSIIVGSAFVLGLFAGSSRMASIFGYLWGTEQPPRPELTSALWLIIVFIIGVTYVLGQ